MTLTTRPRRRKPAASYGTADFTARLVAREAALGIAPITQELHKSIAQPDSASADTPADGRKASPLPGRDGHRDVSRDAFGNVIISGDPATGAYTMRSQWSGRLVQVCAEWRTGKHTIWWQFDEAQMRPVCQRCFGWQGKKGA